MRAASLYGGPAVLVPAGLVVAVAFLIKGWHRGALLVVVTLAGAGLLNVLLKLSFARVRPEAFFDYPLPGSPSFPSGHALYAASVFGGLAVLLTARLGSFALQVCVWIVCRRRSSCWSESRGFTSACTIPAMCSPATPIATIWVTAVALGDRLVRHRRRRRSR